MVRLSQPITALGLLALAALPVGFLAGCSDTASVSGPVSAAAAAPDRPDMQTGLQIAPQPAAASGATPEAEVAAGGTCWATEVTPAVYEEVPGQVQVVQAQVDENGTVIQPPIYRNANVPRLVAPRGEVRFQAPCPAAMTPAFLAALQRALFARGYYQGAITGRMDLATQTAIRGYQLEKGLDSAQLSLETARAFGLVAIPRDPL